MSVAVLNSETLNPGSLNVDQRHERAKFIERLAHEMRGPATTALGALAEVRLALMDPIRSGNVEQYLEMIARGIGRILRAADRLDQTSQLERAVVTYRPSVCHLPTLVGRAIIGAEALARRRGIRVQYVQPEMTNVCYGDSAWFSMAVTELVSNAIRHARAEVHVVLNQTGLSTSIEVTNDGSPSNDFGPARFQISRDLCGLGLSLSIIDDVARAHNGSLAIEPGKDSVTLFGARVTLTLPCIEYDMAADSVV